MEKGDARDSARPTSVVLVHPNALTRQAIAGVLETAGFELVGHTDDWQTLIGLVARHGPKLVLLHRDTSGFQASAVCELVQKAPRSTLVILARPQSPGPVTPALQHGARGYLSVNVPCEDFVQCLRMIEKGNVVVSPEMVDSLKGELAALREPKAKEELSGRQREVLRMVSQGATNREIAQELIISEHTVKVHLRGILSKLSLRNRQAAAAYAVRERIDKPSYSEEAPAPSM